MTDLFFSARIHDMAKKFGMTVEFAGCAEAPESAADAGEPLLTIVPVQAGLH